MILKLLFVASTIYLSNKKNEIEKLTIIFF